MHRTAANRYLCPAAVSLDAVNAILDCQPYATAVILAAHCEQEREKTLAGLPETAVAQAMVANGRWSTRLGWEYQGAVPAWIRPAR